MPVAHAGGLAPYLRPLKARCPKSHKITRFSLWERFSQVIDALLDEIRRARSKLAETSTPAERRGVVGELHASLTKADYASQVRVPGSLLLEMEYLQPSGGAFFLKGGER